MVYKLIGINRKLKKNENKITCEICGTEKIVKNTKFTCSSRCATIRAKFKINFIQRQSGTDWETYINHRLNLWKSKSIKT